VTAMPQTPALLFSLLLASILAAVFELVLGRGLRDLLPFWLASIVGFACGQVAGQCFGLIPWTIGQVHLIEGTAGALLLLIMTRWLRQEPSSRGSK